MVTVCSKLKLMMESREMYCPNCEIDYREDINTCTDCGSQLIESSQMEETTNYEKQLVYPDWCYLINVLDDAEASIIGSLLESENIPVLKRPESTGVYVRTYLGQNQVGCSSFCSEGLF